MTASSPANPVVPKSDPASIRPPLGVGAGAFCGLAAAVLYTGANIALRDSVHVDPFLVSAVKAAPTVLVLGPFAIWLRSRGDVLATSYRNVPRFVLVSLLGQFVGNAAFQFALEIIGLAASVPITLGTLIIGGAISGRVLLGEPVRMKTVLAIILLIAAVIVLSMPDSSASVASESDSRPAWVGALYAVFSGLAYALFGAVMRQTMIGGVSPTMTMLISGVVGTVSLWSATLVVVGVEGVALIDARSWGVMALAGVFNFTAFIALSSALKSLPVVAVNLINASQVAMAAIAGVIIFGEPITMTLLTGIALTFAGLAVLAKRVPRR
ncbi:MAG: DMT family transporter [Planctomycetota bacterium]